MNLERGFRRIVGTVSFTLLFGTLVPNVYVTYRHARWLSAQATYRKCVRQAGYDLWVPGLQGKEREQMYQMGEQQGILGRCEKMAFTPLGPPLDVRDLPEMLDLWGLSMLEMSPGEWILLNGGIGVLLSVGTAAIPWVMFYLIRWFVRGFQTESEQ